MNVDFTIHNFSNSLRTRDILRQDLSPSCSVDIFARVSLTIEYFIRPSESGYGVCRHRLESESCIQYQARLEPFDAEFDREGAEGIRRSILRDRSFA